MPRKAVQLARKNQETLKKLAYKSRTTPTPTRRREESSERDVRSRKKEEIDETQPRCKVWVKPTAPK